VLLLAALTAIRLTVAGLLPLSPDEAYYWVWSRALAPGYPDHPPMVALWIHLGTALAGDGALGVRLLAPLAAAAGSLLLADAGAVLFPGRQAGLWAAAMLNATLLLGIGAVTQTPDTPLLLFWTATLWALARLAASHDGRWWLVAGLCAGLAADSKYTAFLLAPGILAWLLAVQSLRVWFTRWQPWAAAGIALLLFLPVLAWNAEHGWASFLRQGGRTADWRPARAARTLLELAGGQVGLATPILAVLFAAGAVVAARRGGWRRDPRWALLASLTLIPAAVFLQHALGDRVQANWPSIMYPSLALAAAGLPGAWPRWRMAGVVVGVGLTALVYIQASPLALALPRRLDPTLMRLGGWPDLAAAIARDARVSGAQFVAVENYGLASQLARLLPKALPVVGLDPRWANFRLQRASFPGAGLLVRSERLAPEPGLVPIGQVVRARGGVQAEAYWLYRLPGLAGLADARSLPRPQRRGDDSAHPW
jgi:4-amino-4-deoxy-L-arabinose transferase-like glycosyltransferase